MDSNATKAKGKKIGGRKTTTKAKKSTTRAKKATAREKTATTKTFKGQD